MNPELEALQEAIQMLHDLMTRLDDPNATNVVGKCLAALTGLQKEMMSQEGGANNIAQAMAQRMQGGGGGGY